MSSKQFLSTMMILDQNVWQQLMCKFWKNLENPEIRILSPKTINIQNNELLCFYIFSRFGFSFLSIIWWRMYILWHFFNLSIVFKITFSLLLVYFGVCLSNVEITGYFRSELCWSYSLHFDFITNRILVAKTLCFC